MKRRSAGILLHITSLPSRHGIGDLGPGARRFVDYLQRARQNFWQVLPLNPPRSVNSPYDCVSAFAGNPLLISPEALHGCGWLTRRELRDHRVDNTDRVDYRQAARVKGRLLGLAFDRFREDRSVRPRYQAFVDHHAHWLDDYALFMALSDKYPDRGWNTWPAGLRDRKAGALKSARHELADAMRRRRFEQFVFFEQWHALRRYADQRGVGLFGDVPIYVALDSAEVWARPELFKLTRTGRPRFVTGVPPDLFSATGQLWGNPVYDWDRHAADGYDWWVRRLRHNFECFDLLRIDHFRGFVGYWQIPARAKTAESGRWVAGPGDALFREIYRRLPAAALVAEDLGVITPDVRQCIARFGLPTMKVLMFAFGGDDGANEYLPHHHRPNNVVYTGTHDNNTARGWFQRDIGKAEKQRLATLLGRRPTASRIAEDLMRLAMFSVGDLAIAPMQDVLGLGARARMNYPSRTKGNWLWRLKPNQLRPAAADRLGALTRAAGRA